MLRHGRVEVSRPHPCGDAAVVAFAVAAAPVEPLLKSGVTSFTPEGQGFA